MNKTLWLVTFTAIACVVRASALKGHSDSLTPSIPSGVTGNPRALADYLTGRYPEEVDRVQTLYTWIASSIVYDIEKINASGQFGTIDEFVVYTLKNKKAVCQGYAEVFTAVCTHMGIPALTVHGYTRVDGTLRTDLGHAWNLVKIDGTWFPCDPTWGSGYMDNGRYRKSFTLRFFMIHPDTLIRTHMPFDPIWQLRDYPITHDQFLEGGNSGPVYYHFADSLDRYCQLDEIRKAEGTLKRAESTHANRKEIQRLYKKYLDYVTNMKCNEEITRFNEASVTLGTAIDRFNEFREFRGRKSSDPVRVRKALAAAVDLTQQAVRQALAIAPCQTLSPAEIQRLINFIRELETAVSEAYRSL